MIEKGVGWAMSQLNEKNVKLKEVIEHRNLLTNYNKAFFKESNSWLDQWDPKKRVNL